MNFLEDADFKHYFKMFVIGISIFGILCFLFLFVFRDNHGITLKKDTVEYGNPVRVVDLIETVAGNPVEKSDKISSNTISVNGYEITFDEIDVFKLGSQTITGKYTDGSIPKQMIEIHVVDTKKPVIKINKDIDLNMELKDVRKLKVDSYYSVSDNQTPDSKIKIKKYIKEEKYSYGDTVHLIIEAKDKSGNISKKSVPICINAKKEKKEIHEEKKDESEESKNVESSQNESQPTQNPQTRNSSSQNSQSYQVPQQFVQQAPQQTQTVPVQPSRPKPSNKQYLFSQGYDMSSAPSACQSDLLSSGYTGSCTPIQDSDGIYLGMQLIFN